MMLNVMYAILALVDAFVQGHVVVRQTSVPGAAPLPPNWQTMTPEAFCRSSHMDRTPVNLQASDAINFYRNWTVPLAPNPAQSEPEEFAQAMLGQDHFTCRLTDEGCTPDMDCPDVVRWLAADNGTIRDPVRIRQVYFLTVLLDDIFHHSSYEVSEARATAGMLGTLGTDFASTFFPQVSQVARNKCDKKKLRQKLAFAMLFNTITVALGAGLGNPVASLGMGPKNYAEGARAAWGAAFTNGIFMATRDPANIFMNRHIDQDGNTCKSPAFRDARIEDDALFAVRVKELTDRFTAEMARYFDGAAQGTDKIAGQPSQLANYLSVNGNTFFTPNNTMQDDLDDSGKFRREYERKLVAGMVGMAWRLQYCFLHCVDNPNGFCPIHENSPVAHMEFCPEGGAKFCSAACWVPGKKQHRLYPVFGAFEQAGAGSGSGTWRDDGGQWYAYAGEKLKSGPWDLDVVAGIQASYELRNVDTRSDELKDHEVMGIHLNETSWPFMSLPVCNNPYLRSIPDYLKVSHESMVKQGRGKEVVPCACGDDFGTGTFNFYNRAMAGVPEMRCIEDDSLGRNKDIIADYCLGQLRDDSKSITAEWYANCNHVAARMSVRDTANVGVPLDLCAAGTQYFMGRRLAGDSDEQLDAEFCALSFEKGAANTPWFSRFFELTRPNRLALRSMRIPTERAMERCNYPRRNKWAKHMKFENDDHVCRWTGADKRP